MARALISTAVVLLMSISGAGRARPAVADVADGATPTAADDWRGKVDPRVLQTAAEGPTEFLVVLREQADLLAAATLRGKRAKGRFVFQSLTATARSTQGPLFAELDRLGAESRPFWIVNMIWVRGDARAVEAMARRADVARLEANPEVAFAGPVRSEPARRSSQGIEWNLSLVNADDVWALGFTGEGVVVGGQDTGYAWEHPAIQQRYRGWDGGTADHDYNWHDAIHSEGGVCGSDSAEPCDDNGHGTHTMGTMVGDDGAGNQIGMAPGARWIGCRNMDQGNGTPATYSECFQWFVAPTRVDGSDPDPDRAPHVINNSWSCPASEGCAAETLRKVVENTRAAGIAVVVSAGNGGSSCSTVSSPPAIYEASFSIGATDSSDNIAGFSSRGPVTADGSGRRKPDVSAPGVGVRSSVPGGGYDLSSGTSMASPHVAGLVALALSVSPALAGDVDRVEDLIEQTAVPRTTSQSCGGVPGDTIPNNTYGWGRIDALALADLLLEQAVFPAALAVDAAESAPGANGVLEPGEPTEVAPSWHNEGTLAQSLSGSALALGGPEGADYTLLLDHADYGSLEPDATASCRDLEICYSVQVEAPVERPAEHWDAALEELVSDLAGTTQDWLLHIGDSFFDVPRTNPFYPAVESLLHHGVTGGCTATEYCPAGSNTRGQMAVFMLKAAEGGDYVPPACVENEQLFADVPFDSAFCPWIEELAGRGVTSGCGGGNYCPGDSVTRAQMAVFLLKAFEGDGYTPPECTGAFTDVTCPSTFAAWIEELSSREITGGCSTDPPAYCPAAPVTRAQMAVFVTKTFGLTLYGP